jgi:hypothetical protein
MTTRPRWQLSGYACCDGCTVNLSVTSAGVGVISILDALARIPSVGEHSLLREGVAAVLERQPDIMHCVGRP